jgi:predicted TPR repeat methyltransferase
MSENTPNIEPLLTPGGSFKAEYFDQLYAKSHDPWDFASSEYEAAKYDATVAALPRPRYWNALEIGCSIGVLTQLLASRCEQLLAVDVSEAALSKARQRCAERRTVKFELRNILEDFPSGPFDLITLSEVGYYFSLHDLETLRDKIASSSSAGGHIILVHYTGSTNYPLSGERVHQTFLDWEPVMWRRIQSAKMPTYRLDVLERSRG